MNIKKTETTLIAIIVFVIVGMGFYGNFHASKKHNNDNPNIFISVFYGFESFWHKKNYNELNDNVRIAIYLLMHDPNTIDPKLQLEFSESKKGFKKILSHYDKDEVEYIKSGALTYLKMKNDFENQCYLALVNYKPNQIVKIESNKELVKKLSTFGLEKDIKDLKVMEENLNTEINEKLSISSIYPEIIKEEKTLIKKELRKGIEYRNKLLNELFE